MYIPPKHSTQLSQIQENSMISSTFTTITNLPNAIITATVNAPSPSWYLPTEDHRKKLVKDILLNSNHITLNTNTSIRLLPNQTQPSTSPDIITASADLHDRTSWHTIHSFRSDHLPYLPPSVHITRLKKLAFISLKQ